MRFIPDRGVSKKKKADENSVVVGKQNNDKKNNDSDRDTPKGDQKKKEKKVASYYLEVDLIDDVKSIANKNEMYYSALVTLALKNWIANNN